MAMTAITMPPIRVPALIRVHAFDVYCPIAGNRVTSCPISERSEEEKTMFRHWGLKVVVVLAAAVLCTQLMWGQNTGALPGGFKSSSGRPVSRAFVRLRNGA